MVEPDLGAIEMSIDRITFPISKRDMLDHIDDSETILLEGRNVDLRTLIRDINDDFFDSVDEFRLALRDQLAGGWPNSPRPEDEVRGGQEAVDDPSRRHGGY